MARRAVRQAALRRPDLFRLEYETQEVDVAWLRGVDERYNRMYDDIAASRRQAAAKEKQALRKEFEEQGKPPSLSQRELERRFKKQEAEDKAREKEAAEARERAMIENELAVRGGGFHHQR